MIDVSKIRSNQKKLGRIMLIGTDVLVKEGEDSSEDLELLGCGSSLDSEYGSMYHTADIGNQGYQDEELKGSGFSDRFIAIIHHARSQGYDYVWFDRDVETVLEEEEAMIVDDSEYRAKANEMVNDELQIDADAVVSISEDQSGEIGAWVAAWVFIRKPEA